MDRPKLKRKHPIPIIQVPLGIVRIKILIGKNNWHVETCRNKLSKKIFKFLWFFCFVFCIHPVYSQVPIKRVGPNQRVGWG